MCTETCRNKTSYSAQLQDSHILKGVYGADIVLKRTCQSNTCHGRAICTWLKGKEGSGGEDGNSEVVCLKTSSVSEVKSPESHNKEDGADIDAI